MRTEAEDSGPSGYAAARLRLLQEGARSGPPRRTALADLTDDWLTGLFTAGAEGMRGVSLVAVGGYGRGELSPRSDLDLLLLHDGGDSAAVAALADRIWYPVWDLGPRPRPLRPHPGRGPQDGRRGPQGPARPAGRPPPRRRPRPHRRTAHAVLADWRNQAPKRLPELQELCAERAERQGELQYLLEPDLKEARGGLRDATALRAVAASWLADAPREGLADARRRLLDVRDALHLPPGRATDRLASRNRTRSPPSSGLLDADTLLRQVYEAARVVSYASDVTWREVGRVLRSRAVRPRLRAMLGGAKPVAERSPLAEGVVEQDGEVVLARAARPERDPVLPLRAAAAAAQAGLPLSLHAVRRLAAAARPLPAPWPAEAREQLVTLLGSGPSDRRGLGGAGGRGADHPAAARLGAGALPPAAQRRAHLDRRPAPHRDRRARLRADPPRAAAPTCSSSPPCCTTSARAGRATTRWPARSSPGTWPPASASTARTSPCSPPSYATTCCSSTPPPGATWRTRPPSRSVAEAVGSQGTLELLHALTEADALATGPGRLVVLARLARRRPGQAGRRRARRRRTARSRRPPRPRPSRSGSPIEAVAHRRPRAVPARADRTADAGRRRRAGRPGAARRRTAHRRARPGPACCPRWPGCSPCTASPSAPPSCAPWTCPTSVDGSVLLLNWRVAAEYGSLPQAARLRADLVRALDGSLDIAGRLAERDAAYPRRRGAVAPRRRACRSLRQPPGCHRHRGPRP